MAAPLIFAFSRNFKQNCTVTVLSSLTRYKNFYGRRHLLSPAYQCNDVWNERLGESMLQFDINDYIIKLNEKADKGGGITAVDINLFANRVYDCDGTQLETAKQLFNKYRKTQHALNYLDSTAYAVARSYIQLDQTDDLIDMLQDKVNYGLFLDHHGASILMDHFIKQENYLDASRVAYELMLQEDLVDHPLTRTLALYSCHMHLKNPVVMETDEDATEVEPEAEDDDGIVTYMRVPFIRNPHYEDHFDLVDEQLLLGKTLAVLGNKLGGELGSSYELVGWTYYEKFQKGLDVVRRCLEGGDSLAEEALNVYRQRLTEVEVVAAEDASKRGHAKKVSQEMKDQYLEELETLTTSLRQKNKLTANALHDLVYSHVTQQITAVEPRQVDEHRQQLDDWNEIRQAKYREQCVREANQKRKEEIVGQLKALKEKEELLNYFEMKDEIELAKSQAPTRQVSEDEEQIEKSVQALLQDSTKPRRLRKERDNRRDHKKENREKYLALKKLENIRR